MQSQNKRKQINLLERIIKDAVINVKDSSEKCKLCQKCFRGNFELNEHIAIEHNGERWYCNITGCHKEYKSINGYRYHLINCHQLETSSKHNCLSCNKKFLSHEDLINHNRSLHGAPKLACSTCASKFAFKNNLIRHKRKCLGNAKKDFSCFICGKTFQKSKYLLEHINGQHKPPKYKCVSCGLKFSYRASLKAHINKNHEPELF